MALIAPVWMKLQLLMKSQLPIKKRILVSGLRCMHCNAILPSSAHFCGICREKLDKHVKIWPAISLVSDVTTVVLPLFAIVLWSLSLHSVNVRDMTDLGLVSVLPTPIIIALITLTLSFSIASNQRRLRVPVILLHVLLLIFMLYGITTLVEEAPRFAIVYRHAGYTDFIMRTDTVDPNLDAYFNWPGFFILSAFLTQAAGYHDILSYAAWAPVFFNLIYLGPLYLIFTSATTDKRIVWLGVWFFYVTNWIGQDYFSPQGLNFFLYLLVIAILLKWFKKSTPISPYQRTRKWRLLGRLPPFMWKIYAWLTAPDAPPEPVNPGQRQALLASVVIIFAFMVFSHPLTPFFTIISVAALAVFNRCTPRWLPILMSAMTAAWLIIMAQPYLVGHIQGILSEVGQLRSAITSNVTGRVQEANAEHSFIEEIRLIMTFFIWGLAFVGAVRRLRRGYRDVSYALLAVAPFPIILVQSYGGEMLLRIYLFTLPMMTFFAAALFYSAPMRSTLQLAKAGYRAEFLAQKGGSAVAGNTSPWIKAAIVVTSMVLLGGFLFTRYGNERLDYMTNAEIKGIRHLYNIAPPGSLLIAGWDGTPWQFQDYEQYNNYVLTQDLSEAVVTRNVGAIVKFIKAVKPPQAYLIFTRSQKAVAQAVGLPPGTLERLEQALLTSGKFALVYSNPDAQIFQFTGGRGSP
jgi:hypothetical protein